MPNTVKYATSGDTLSLRRGNFFFGVGDVPKGPTSSTGHWSGIAPSSGGYTIYINKASNGPSIYVASSDSQLINFTKGFSGQNFTGASQCVNWYFTQSTYACVNIDYPTIPTSGLTFISDVGATISYPLSGSSSYSMDVAGTGGSVTYNSGTVYTSEYGGGFQFNGSSGSATCNPPLQTAAFTYVIIARSTTTTWTSAGGVSQGVGNGSSFFIYSLAGTTQVNFYIGSLPNDSFSNPIGGIAPTSILTPHMYVISSNGTNLHKGYVDNGSPISSTTNLSRTSNSNAAIQWGNYFSFLNMVSYVQLYYTRQLSDSEVLSIYNGYATRFDFGLDPDAAAFIVAAGITNSTQKTAINQLVLDLKSYSLWTKFSAIYPFVGGTATSHKYNLKDPRDLDAAYRIQFNGGWTHDSNGIQGDGSTGYADTFAAMNTAAIPNRSNHWSSYNRILPSGTKYNGIFDTGLFVAFGGAWGSGQNWFASLQNFSNSGVASQVGFVNGTVTSTSASALYRNGTSIWTPNNPTSMTNQYNYYLGATNQGGSPQFYNTTNIAFASLGGSMNATNASNFYTAVQAFQTTLGRQV